MSQAKSSGGQRLYTQLEVDALVASKSSRLETKLDVLLRGLKSKYNIEVDFEEEEEDRDGDEDEG